MRTVTDVQPAAFGCRRDSGRLVALGASIGGLDPAHSRTHHNEATEEPSQKAEEVWYSKRLGGDLLDCSVNPVRG